MSCIVSAFQLFDLDSKLLFNDKTPRVVIIFQLFDLDSNIYVEGTGDPEQVAEIFQLFDLDSIVYGSHLSTTLSSRRDLSTL